MRNITLSDYDQSLLERFPVTPGFSGSVLYKRWNPAVKRRIIKLYSEGASDQEVCAELGVTVDTLANWIAGNIKVSNIGEQRIVVDMVKTVYAGRLSSQAWWERQGRKNLKSREFNASLWTTNMSNRYGWNSSRREEHRIVETVEHVDVDAVVEKWRENAIEGELVEPESRDS